MVVHPSSMRASMPGRAPPPRRPWSAPAAALTAAADALEDAPGRGAGPKRRVQTDVFAGAVAEQGGQQRHGVRTTRALISLERLCGTQLELCAAAALLEAPDRLAAPTAAGPWAGRTSGRAAAERQVPARGRRR